MTCDPLPNTGLDAPVLAVLIIAVVCLLLGLGMLVVGRRRGRTAATLMVLLILGCGAAIVLVPASPALASPSDCTADPGNNSLTITQTSTMEGIAPGIAPAEITGLVVNNGPDSTFITAVAVEIVSISTHPRSPTGRCDATDYALLNPRMPVDRTLGPGGSTPFAGASIGFSNKSINQDACKRATIHLRYTTVPE